jgi:hypothetical protein
MGSRNFLIAAAISALAAAPCVRTTENSIQPASKVATTTSHDTTKTSMRKRRKSDRAIQERPRRPRHRDSGKPVHIEREVRGGATTAAQT